MERAEIFELVRVRIHAIVQTNRTDRKFVAQTSSNRVAHIVQANVFGRGQKISRVGENRSLQLAENRKCVFNIEHRKKFAADWMAVIIVRTEVALAETAHRCCSAIKKTFIDRNFGRFVRTAARKRMDDAGTRIKRDRRLVDPSLETTLHGLIFNHARCEWLWSERKIIADAHRAADEFDVAAKRARRH